MELDKSPPICLANAQHKNLYPLIVPIIQKEFPGSVEGTSEPGLKAQETDIFQRCLDKSHGKQVHAATKGCANTQNRKCRWLSSVSSAHVPLLLQVSGFQNLWKSAVGSRSTKRKRYVIGT